jgi:BirA family biotin operon repressor/biotin-[acetyl-CoA-carboxylase] ligase
MCSNICTNKNKNISTPILIYVEQSNNYNKVHYLEGKCISTTLPKSENCDISVILTYICIKIILMADKFFNKVIRINSTDSTNAFLEEFVKQNSFSAENVAVITKFQHSGKGYENNKWESEDSKNLLCSILIHPQYLHASQQFLISVTTSVSIHKVLTELGIEDVSIKWPNDIYIKDEKICGILIKHNLLGESISNSIIGFGLNVNQEKFSSTIPNPTSIRLSTGKETDLEQFSETLLKEIADNLQSLEEGNVDYFIEYYLNTMYRKDKTYEYIHLGNKITAKITGIDEFGFLCLIDKDGNEISCDLKEIKYII